MVIENIVNCISLFAVILGLLGCLFKYIRAPRRGYLYLVIFFLASFSSDYYWTIYSLVMHSNPDVSEFLAYIGWNVGYVFLAAAVFQMLQKEAKRYFHPLILLPVLTNLPQLLLYLQFGGVINNLLQVGMTTVVMVLCMKGVVYYLKNRKAGAKFPHLAVSHFCICSWGTECGLLPASSGTGISRILICILRSFPRLPSRPLHGGRRKITVLKSRRIPGPSGRSSDFRPCFRRSRHL